MNANGGSVGEDRRFPCSIALGFAIQHHTIGNQEKRLNAKFF